MASVNLEKTLKYLKIQEILWSENLNKYYRNNFICFFYPETNHHISYNLIIICLKRNLRGIFFVQC